MNLRFKQALDKWVGGLLVLVNVLAARTLGILLRRDHSLGKPPRNIIFIKLLGMGSVLLAADAIFSLRKRYPEARFTLIGGRGFKGGLGPTGLFDEIIEMDDRSFFRLSVSALKILFRTWGMKGRWVADLEVYSRLTTIYSLWTCARNRFGFTLEVVSFRNRLNTHNQYFNRFRPVSENYNELARQMGVTDILPFEFPAHPVASRRPFSAYGHIAINNTCSTLSLERKLPEDKLEALCRHLLARYPHTLAFVGAPSDYAPIAAFLKRFEDIPEASRLQNLAGKLSFPEYYRFLATECALMFSIDSAPLHVARKLGLPTVSAWGPTRPDFYLGPVRESSEGALDRILYLSKSCSPCLHHTEELPCGGDNHCMKDLLSETLCQNLDALILTLQQLENHVGTPSEV